MFYLIMILLCLPIYGSCIVPKHQLIYAVITRNLGLRAANSLPCIIHPEFRYEHHGYSIVNLRFCNNFFAHIFPESSNLFLVFSLFIGAFYFDMSTIIVCDSWKFKTMCVNYTNWFSLAWIPGGKSSDSEKFSIFKN